SNQVRISSPGTFDYMIYDLSGKVINKGRLNAGLNNLKTSIDAPGMYVIRFSNGGEYWSEKIMRQ
ncbi:MAG TPA: T9SS type A sorting domain-containing protein, partial [Chitinophagaceae bacterium]|nr:T9SS type A sorting domain-containing protein [Chitinophagaceae bacterium]